MGFDWKKLEREENERQDKSSWTFGLGWLAIGVIGPVVAFLITGRFDLVGAVLWIAIGLMFVVPTLVIRRSRARSGREATSHDPSDP